MKSARWIASVTLMCAAFACADRDAQLREEFRQAALELLDNRVPGAKNTIIGRDGWLLHRGEIEYLNAGSYVGENAVQANPEAPPEYADPVPAIVDFHRQLEDRGIALYVVPVPVRPAVYPEAVLGPEPFAEREEIPSLHPYLGEMVSILQNSGVRAIDMTPVFLRQREHPKRGPVYPRSDTHWTPFGITRAAEILAADIRQMPWFESVPKQQFRAKWLTKKNKGMAYQDYEKAYDTVLKAETLWIRRITRNAETGRKNFGLHNPESPVIVIGDSNSTRWTNFKSGLPHALAFELGFPIDVLAVPGGGATKTRLNFMRKVRAEPEYLDGKRVVIWCFSARAFTNTDEGWIPIPL